LPRSTYRSGGNDPGLRRLLDVDGIGSVKFGQSPAVVAARLRRLFGPPVGPSQIPNSYRRDACGFSWEEWQGVGAASDGRLFAAELAVEFRDARFVGYDYGPNDFQTDFQNDWSQYASHPMMVATGRGLAVGDPLARGRRLYGRAFVVTTRMQGTPPNPRLKRLPAWEASTASGGIEGGIGTVSLVGDAFGRRRGISGISAGVGPITPCK